MMLSYGLAERWNIREATRLLSVIPGRELVDVSVPPFAENAVRVIKQAPQRWLESLQKKPRTHLRCVTAISSTGPKEIIPYCVFSFFAPPLIYLPYPPDEMTPFGRFQLLHEIGHATTASNWCLVERYQFIVQLLGGGFVLALISQSLFIWILWGLVGIWVLQHVLISWYIDREVVADKFALAHLKLSNADKQIIEILEMLWDTSEISPQHVSRYVERTSRLYNAKAFWQIDNIGHLRVIAAGYNPGKPTWFLLIPLLFAGILSGFWMPSAQIGYVWAISGLSIAMLTIYFAIGIRVLIKQGSVLDKWADTR